MSDELRYYETFYGIHVNDWQVTFGSFSNHRYLLEKEYLNEGCDTTEYTEVTDSNIIDFLYSEHIKKTYFIEGTIKGHITIAASSATAEIGSYQVSVCKVHENTIETVLYSTGWVSVNDTLAWNATYSVGEEMVYPFKIDAWDYSELDEYERIFVRVEFSGCTDGNAALWHSNDATWCDLKIEIPFKM